MTETTDTTAASPTLLDWLVLLLTGIAGLFLIVFPFLVAPAFVAIFEDLKAALPVLTQLVVRRWFTQFFALTALVVAGVGLLGRFKGSRHARPILFGGLLIAAVGIALSLLGLYLPLFRVR